MWNPSLKDSCELEKRITWTTKPPRAERQKGNCRDEIGSFNIRQAVLEERMWPYLTQPWNSLQTLNSSLGILPIILVTGIPKFRDWTCNSKTRLENITSNSEKLLLWLLILPNTMYDLLKLASLLLLFFHFIDLFMSISGIFTQAMTFENFIFKSPLDLEVRWDIFRHTGKNNVHSRQVGGR